MIKEFINFMRNDYKRCSMEFDNLNLKYFPKWIYTVIYIVLAPLGLVLYPIIKVITNIMIKRMLNKKS